MLSIQAFGRRELEAVIDRNTDTRLSQYVSQYGFSISQYAFWRIVAPLLIVTY